MGVFTKKSREVSRGPTADSTSPEDNKMPLATDDAVPNDSDESASQPDALPTEHAQAGVQEVEGVTLTWSKKSLIAVFIKYVAFGFLYMLA